MIIKQRFFYLLIWLLSFCIATETFAQTQQSIVNECVLTHNTNDLIPFKSLDKQKIAIVTAFPEKYTAFIDMARRYADLESFDFNRYDEHTKYCNTIIVAGTPTELRSDLLLMVKQSLVNKKQIVLVSFDDKDKQEPWATNYLGSAFSELRYPKTGMEAQRNAAMSIFGGLAITAGKHKTTQTRLQYPEFKNITGLDLATMTKRIDGIAAEAVREHATPGLVVMAIKDGQVIFDKSYGFHTYSNKVPTQTTDIFDLASVSKIAGTTPVIMHLQETGVINLDSTMGTYLWQAKTTNKKDIPIRSVLLHEAGFTPFIPFYKELKAGDLQRYPDQNHQVKVADSAYLKNNYYRDVMWPEMLKSAVKPMGNYVYSDISMYVMKEIAEHETAEPIEDYVQQLLYKPIGMKTAGYKPRERFAKDRIVPTQNDTVFRKVLLQGYVHDEGAAMAGGVAGHAGLFASANDLAIYGQLLLNRGTYGGVHYFKPETVDLFTSKQSKTSRRGLGFDRADPKDSYPSKYASTSVYGHTGYTGTCIWMDPKEQLIYIFLSNRVHPQVSPKLSDLGIRMRILDAIYETINKKK